MDRFERTGCNHRSDSLSRQPNPWVDAGEDLANGQRRIRGQVCAGRAAFGKSDGDVRFKAKSAPLQVRRWWVGRGNGVDVLLVGVGRGRLSRTLSRSIGAEVRFEVGLVDPHAVEVCIKH